MQKNAYHKSSGRRELITHLVLWIISLQLLFDISGLYYSFRALLLEGQHRVDEAFIFTPLLIGLFYWNSNFLIPWFLNRRDWWKYILSLVLSFIILLLMALAIFHLLLEKGWYFDLDKGYFMDMLSILLLLAIGASTSFRVSQTVMQQAVLNKEAIKKQQEAELKYLTAQINPHFLFNTLNAIYASATAERAPKTTEAILKLSEIMRYPLKQGAKIKVNLSDEITFIKGYIDLQKLRLGDQYPVHFTTQGPIKGLEIAPHLFIPFIENAFKYGISQRQPTSINIILSHLEGVLHFQCQNEIIRPNHFVSHQLGIENVSARLEILYPQNYSLEVARIKNSYHVNLKIKISS